MSFPTPAPAPSRRWLLPVVSAAVVLVVGAVAVTAIVARGTRTTATPPPPAATATPAASPSTVAPAVETSHVTVAADPAVLDACDMAAKAQGTDDLYNPGKMRTIGRRAAQSANTAAHQQGLDLTQRADAAAAAGSGDLQAGLALGTAATTFATWCVQQKFTTG